MSGIIDYIVGHSAWIIGGAILIILAIIGYYTEKANNEKHKKLLKENLLKELQKENSIKLEKKPLIKEREKLEKLPEEKIFDDESGFGKYERLPEDDIFKI